MTLFDVAGADELARQQRVEQSAEIDAEIVLDELRVELRVVRDLDRARRFEQTAQRRERFTSRVAVGEVIEVDDVDAIRGRELDQS